MGKKLAYLGKIHYLCTRINKDKQKQYSWHRKNYS